MTMELPETQNSRDARIERLWRRLDPEKRGELDINGLKRGLVRIDHPLKNANAMLKDVISAMDKNGDQVIQYEEFRIFVEQTEKELLSLFHSIDRDQNGKLDKAELKRAFKRAGLTVPDSKLDQFFAEVDENHDGYITFEEWRNFLLFLPTNKQPGLKAVLSYYSSAVTLNADSEPSINEDVYEGLGENQQFSSTPPFLSVLFGAIIKLSEPPSTSTSASATNNAPRAFPEPSPCSGTDGYLDTVESNEMYRATQPAFQATQDQRTKQAIKGAAKAQAQFSTDATIKKSLLTEILPDPGYFAAGAVAGVVSRTSTAPLDRIKVYLIARTGPPNYSLSASKGGWFLTRFIKNGAQSLALVSKDLWQAGGMRSLFAGNGLNVLKVMPESAIKFGSYEAAKRTLAHLEGHDDPRRINPYSKFVAGGIGGMISQLFVYPIDTLKFRMQCETVHGGLHGNALIFETAKKMYRQGAIKTSYRGLTMGLVGMFPYSAIDLGTFEFLKGYCTRRVAKRTNCSEDDVLLHSLVTGGIGAFSGAFGASVVYPLNLLRTRLQAQGTVLHPPTYTGIWDVAQKTIKNEGVPGLFKGITPNLLKVVPAVSITYMVYENAKKALDLK